MTYEEALDCEFTRTEVVSELKRHGADIEEFFDEHAPKNDRWSGDTVLTWLGY